jgi:hypothetical protein
MSDVCVRDAEGNAVSDGWLDFVHGGDPMPLHVFWLFLRLLDGDGSTSVKRDVSIPDHVWNRMADSSRDACGTDGHYDAKWANEPKVQRWMRERRLTSR